MSNQEKYSIKKLELRVQLEKYRIFQFLIVGSVFLLGIAIGKLL